MDRPVVSRVISLTEERDEAVATAIGALRAGELIVVPTDTVYGLAADAFNPAATGRIFEVKGRPRSMPLPVLVSRPRQAWALASFVPPEAEALAAAYWPGALTLVLPMVEGLAWDLGDADGTIALRMPDQPVLIELLETVGPLAVTSANKTTEPTSSEIEGVRARLGEDVAVYLDVGPAPGDRGSTIVDLAGAAPRIVRAGPLATAEIQDILDASA